MGAPKLKIAELIHNLQQPSFFDDNWVDLPSGSDEESQKPIWINKITRASCEILKFSMLWLLSGRYSYLTTSNHFIEFGISRLEEKLMTIPEQIENISDQNIRNEVETSYNINILELFKPLKRMFIYFGRDIRNQLKFGENKAIVRVFPIEDHIGAIDDDVREYLKAFFHVFDMTRIEHFGYEPSRSTIRELLLIGHGLKISNIDETIKKSVGVKVNFLIKKLLYKDKDSSSSILTYSFLEGDDVELSLDKIEIDTKLTGWDEIIKVHYGIDSDFKSKQRQRMRNCENGTPDYKYFHAKMKILKDDTKDQEHAYFLLNEFKEFNYNSYYLLENYAAKVTESYLFNNCISLKLENQTLELRQFEEIYSEIRNHQNSIQIKNYFPWKRLADSIDRKMENLSNKLTDSEVFNEFKQLLKLLDKVIVNKLDECWSWCKEKKFIPFQFPLNECLSSYTISVEGYSDVNLFLFSSFILPINYKTDDIERMKLKMKCTKFEALRSVYEKLQFVIEEVKESSDKMKKQERRSIEVLAIFSGVALFSVGSIQIFGQKPVADDPNVYYKFILSFGYSLSLFVMLIWLITRDNIKKVSRGHLIIITMLFIFGFLVIGQLLGGDVLQLFKFDK